MKKKVLLTLFMMLFLFYPVSSQVCGDGVCELGEEDRSTCPNDCWNLSIEEQVVLDGAKQRIEQFRKGIGNLTIKYENGTPMINAQVDIQQVSHEFFFGSNFDNGMVDEILEDEFGYITELDGQPNFLTENQVDLFLADFKNFANYIFVNVNWNIYENVEDQINYTLYDTLIDWLKQQEYTLKAGHLVWNIRTPSWVPDDCNQIRTKIENRIRDFMNHYQGDFYNVNVINELANPFRSLFLSDKMTPCIQENGTIQWGKYWLEVAGEEDSITNLAVNEIAISAESGFDVLLNGLIDGDGNPLYDTIGIQSHMHNSIWKLDDVWNAADSYYSFFGVPIHFTEVTVLSGTPIAGPDDGWGSVTTPEGEDKQAEYAVWFYTVLFSHPGVESILWWNFADAHSWKGAPAGLLREDMSHKPAYDALINLIYTQWWTTSNQTTNTQGNVWFTGFYGDYEIKITKQGTSQIFNISLSKQESNDFSLTWNNVCGNGVCDAGETNINCSSDCYCGDGICWIDENATSCSEDCTCSLADTDFSGDVNIGEIINYITRYRNGEINIGEVIQGITEYKYGC